MLDFFRNLLNIGIDETPELIGQRRYIKRTNFVSLSILVLVVLYGLLFYALGAHFHAYLMMLVFTLFLLVPLFNSIKWYNTARMWMIILVGACVYYYGSSFGKQASVHYLFFVFITLPFLIFPISQMRYIAFSLACFIITFYAMEYEWLNLPTVLNNAGQQVMHQTMIALVIFWLIANYLYYEITNKQVENKLRANNARLESKNKELEQFAYIASHDLQEPLLTVTNFSGILNERYAGKMDEKADKYLAYILDGSKRMKQLIEGLMEYSRIGRHLNLIPVDCKVMVNDVLTELNEKIELNKAKVECNGLPIINGYEKELRMLFQHLISNAIKFHKTEMKPFVQLRAEKMNGKWQFAVSDNGIGIDEKFQHKIFIIFQRLHTRREYEGTGIGLAHCRKIVELHGGDIWVESKLGEGSTFYFTIPEQKP